MKWSRLGYSVATPLNAAARPIFLIWVLVPDNGFWGTVPYIACIGSYLMLRFGVMPAFDGIPTREWWSSLPRFAPFESHYGYLLWGIGISATPSISALYFAHVSLLDAISVAVAATLWTAMSAHFLSPFTTATNNENIPAGEARNAALLGTALAAGGLAYAFVRSSLGPVGLFVLVVAAAVVLTVVVGTCVGVFLSNAEHEGHLSS